MRINASIVSELDLYEDVRWRFLKAKIISLLSNTPPIAVLLNSDFGLNEQLNGYFSQIENLLFDLNNVNVCCAPEHSG